MNTIKIHTISLGCPKNLVDTEKLLGKIRGFSTFVEDPKDANVVIINTCAFIQSAVEEAIETILDIVMTIKDIEPAPFVIVTGCLVERYKDELEKELPEIDLFIPIKEQWKIPDIIKEQFIITSYKNPGKRLITTPNSYGYLKIAEGCNHNCSFCIIPKIRGKLISYPMDKLVKEAEEILSSGRREIIVVAQDVTSYGWDLGLKKGLYQLLEKIASLPNLVWLRLLYLYPKGINDEFLKFLKDITPPFVPYFDIPMQHSHPDILKKMGRPFKIDGRELIDKIRKYFENAAIRTSIIVGFPGERETHFQDLINFIKEIKFQHLGVFEYSDEEESRAQKLGDKVDDHIKTERKNIIMEIQREISKSYLEYFVGEKLQLIVDKKSEEWPTLYEARTWFQAPEIDGKTYLTGEGIKVGDVVEAEVIDSFDYDLNAIL